jgi:hypothetical protein
MTLEHSFLFFKFPSLHRQEREGRGGERKNEIDLKVEEAAMASIKYLFCVNDS